MNGHSEPGRPGGLLASDAAERLGTDDQATRTAERLQADALLAQQLRAEGGALIRRGWCSNCGQRCLPSAVYCDADCRADHEARVVVRARQGRGPRACGA